MSGLYRSLRRAVREQVRVSGCLLPVWLGLMWVMTAACIAGYLYLLISNLKWLE